MKREAITPIFVITLILLMGVASAWWMPYDSISLRTILNITNASSISVSQNLSAYMIIYPSSNAIHFNSTVNVQFNRNVTAPYFFGKLLCTDIWGGTDTDFCVESGGAGGGDKWLDGGAYIYPNGTFANNTAIFGYLNATDWTNVTFVLNNSKQWNASAICINGVCQSSWIWNTTPQIWAVIDNNTFVKLSQNLWNTTAQVWAVADNGTFNTSAGVSTYALAVNSTMRTHVVSVNTTSGTYCINVNSTMKDYADGRLVYYNASAGTYTTQANSTMRVYVLEVNGTMKTYAVSVNSTMKDYTDGKLITYNNSAGTYALAVNSTMKAYVDSTEKTNTTSQVWAVVDNLTFVKKIGDTMSGNLNMTIANVTFSSAGQIGQNGTCMLISGPTSRLEIC